MKSTYYGKIEEYYDGDAAGFEERYWKNPVLQRMRQDFREEVKRFSFSSMLEIGCGTGLDLVHFAVTHPSVQVAGIDISGEMHRLASAKIQNLQLHNATAAKGKIEELEDIFPGRQFDMIYVFFGALNTVEDLEGAARILHRASSPGGILVLSFVNRHYLAGMFIELLKLRFRAAFSRLSSSWGGYSPSRSLPSRCYSNGQIRKAFSDFIPVKRKGYSIVHPAWYYHRLNRLLRRFDRILWKTDMALQKTPLWKFGEYTLFVFRKPDNGDK